MDPLKENSFSFVHVNSLLHRFKTNSSTRVKKIIVHSPGTGCGDLSGGSIWGKSCNLYFVVVYFGGNLPTYLIQCAWNNKKQGYSR